MMDYSIHVQQLNNELFEGYDFSLDTGYAREKYFVSVLKIVRNGGGIPQRFKIIFEHQLNGLRQKCNERTVRELGLNVLRYIAYISPRRERRLKDFIMQALEFYESKKNFLTGKQSSEAAAEGIEAVVDRQP